MPQSDRVGDFRRCAHHPQLVLCSRFWQGQGEPGALNSSCSAHCPPIHARELLNGMFESSGVASAAPFAMPEHLARRWELST